MREESVKQDGLNQNNGTDTVLLKEKYITSKFVLLLVQPSKEVAKIYKEG